MKLGAAYSRAGNSAVHTWASYETIKTIRAISSDPTRQEHRVHRNDLRRGPIDHTWSARCSMSGKLAMHEPAASAVNLSLKHCPCCRVHPFRDRDHNPNHLAFQSRRTEDRETSASKSRTADQHVSRFTHQFIGEHYRLQTEPVTNIRRSSKDSRW